MAGRAKHAERSRRSYRKNREQMQAAARRTIIRTQTNKNMKQQAGAIARLITVAKNLQHKTQEK